jgi:hypothetical protein
MNRTNGGPAFPTNRPDYPSPGMSLRDYAIIQYTAAMLANTQRYEPRPQDRTKPTHIAMLAEAADLADAMLLARK